MLNSILNVLPNLSIGVVCIGALVYTVVLFVKTLDERAKSHERAMMERETALRAVERDMRGQLSEIVGKATSALNENTRVLARVVDRLDSK